MALHDLQPWLQNIRGAGSTSQVTSTWPIRLWRCKMQKSFWRAASSMPPNPPSVYCAKPDLGSTWRNDSAAKLKKKEEMHSPETNIAPEHRPFQKETSILTIHFQVWTISFPDGNQLSFIPSPFPSRSAFFFCPSAFWGEACGDEVSPLGHKIVWPGTMKVNFFSFPNVPIHGAGK